MWDPLIGTLLTLLALSVLLPTAYLAVLTLAAYWGRAPSPPPGPGRRRFAVLVPAHDEEALIGRLLRSLAALDYPRDRYDVYVVADNCADGTAERARALGARVYERCDAHHQAKGFALRWLLEQIALAGARYDAFVVLDADSVVAANLLRRFDARLAAGAQVVQAHYSVLNAQESTVAALRYAALAAVHYLRPLGRAALGLSCGLKGNGMCFAAPVLEECTWQWYTLAEDVEFHLALVERGVRVEFAPETTVLAEMPVTYAQASSQNARWERGRLQLVRQRVPRLLAEGLRRRSLLRLDAAAEQLVPPLSVLHALGAVCLVASLALGARLPAGLAAFSLGAQGLYFLAALHRLGAPPRAYLALAGAPLYIAWKLQIYLRALLSTRGGRWIRTARLAPRFENGGSSSRERPGAVRP